MSDLGRVPAGAVAPGLGFTTRDVTAWPSIYSAYSLIFSLSPGMNLPSFFLVECWPHLIQVPAKYRVYGSNFFCVLAGEPRWGRLHYHTSFHLLHIQSMCCGRDTFDLTHSTCLHLIIMKCVTPDDRQSSSPKSRCVLSPELFFWTGLVRNPAVEWIVPWLLSAAL